MRWFRSPGTLMAALVLVCGGPAHAQIQKGCNGVNYIGADSSNPFTAEYRTTSTTPSTQGVPKTTVQREDVARDSQGRIRFAKHGVTRRLDDRKPVALEASDGKPFTVTQEEFATLINIFDCASGTSVVLQPGLRITRVKEGHGAPAIEPIRRAYSDPYIPGPEAKMPPNVSVELLGTREIQGISARGVRTTTLGTESDGDWSGKAIRATELWVSDVLAVQMLKVDKDLRAGSESISELIEIKQEEPDPSLFDVPKDYEVNPKLPPRMTD